MKKLVWIAFSIVLILSVQACNENRRAKNYNEKTKVDSHGLEFISKGIVAGRDEIKLSQLAVKNAKDPKVISFAKMMITDHTAMGKEFSKLADDQYVTVQPQDTIDTEHKQIMSSLIKKSGAEFDKEYMQVMVADHEKAIKLFEDNANNQDNEVKNLAEKTLPKLKSHLKAANAICAELK